LLFLSVSGIVAADITWEGKMKWLARVVSGVSVLCASSAFAAGYDTPMLYSARHMGMGGTAIGYTDDASSIFHNPAGMSLSGKGSVMVDVSPLFGQITGSPDDGKRSFGSNLAVSPFFFVGGTYQIHDRIHIGMAAYLLGGAAGSYTYDVAKDNGFKTTNTHSEDSAKLAFIEVAPSVSVRIMEHLRLGVAYRPVITTFDRKRVDTPEGKSSATWIDMNMAGIGWGGFRIGAQYDLGPVSMGLNFRNRVDVTVKADSITYASATFNGASYQFILPAKLGYGAHWKVNDDLRVALDVEYMFNSQNTIVLLQGTQIDNGVTKPVTVPNSSVWQDSMAFRVGAGYKISKPVELRIGYILDTQAANAHYPTAFGSPPGFTQIGTAGVGYKFNDAMDASFAFAGRYGKATVTDADVSNNDPATGSSYASQCPFCGHAGDYAILLFGAYLDFRYKFGVVDAAPVVHQEAPLELPDAPTPAGN
jgi:long-subunit fatty acid transport protein